MKREKKTRMLKTQTEIQHSSLDVPFVKKRVRRRVRMMKSVVFFQRCCSRVASRETAWQGNSIPRETGEWKTVLNYMGVGAIYRRKKGCDHRPRTVLNTSES